MDQLRTARRITSLEAENARLLADCRRLRAGLLEAVMTFDRSDPFYDLFMERFGDLLPIRQQHSRGDAA